MLSHILSLLLFIIKARLSGMLEGLRGWGGFMSQCLLQWGTSGATSHWLVAPYKNKRADMQCKMQARYGFNAN